MDIRYNALKLKLEMNILMYQIMEFKMYIQKFS